MQTQETNQEDWESQLIDYAFGAMEPGAAAEFGRALEECRTHVTLADSYMDVVGALGAAVPPAEPPEGHKSRLMTRISSTPQERAPVAVEGQPTPAVARPRVLGTSAATPQAATGPALAGVTDLGAYRERRRLPAAIAALAAAAAVVILLLGAWGIANQVGKNNAEQQLAEARSKINIPVGYIAFPVQGQQPMTNASAIVLFNPQTNDAHMLANGLQPLTPDKVYEMWLLPPKGDPVAAGTFAADQSGHAQKPVSAPSKISDYSAVAVTLENAPGGPKPSGPIVLLGKLPSP